MRGALGIPRRVHCRQGRVGRRVGGVGSCHSSAEVYTELYPKLPWGPCFPGGCGGLTAGGTGSLDTEVDRGPYCNSYNSLPLSAGWPLVPICNEETEATCGIIQGIIELRPLPTS